MNSVQVAFPILRGKRYFRIEKGRRWSLAEHVLLQAVTRAPASATELSKQSLLPRRVVIEAFLRLMRANFAEVIVERGEIKFGSTPLGLIQSKNDELQNYPVITNRWMSFCVDQVSGTVFRSKEVPPVHPEDLKSDVIRIPPSDLHAIEDFGDVFEALEGEDEVIVGVKPTVERLVRRYGVVTVHSNGLLEGLPSRATPELRGAILGAAQSKLTMRVAAQPRIFAPVHQSEQMIDASFDQSDLVIGGDEHRTLLSRTIRNARQRVVIHSTFLLRDNAEQFLNDMKHAASYGTRIDILWGQDEERKKEASSRPESIYLREKLTAMGCGDAIVVHSTTTGSHAKIVLADDGQGNWSSIVGSCNWLASGFDFEVSVRLRDPAICSQVAKVLSNLAKGRETIYTQLAAELAVLSRDISRLKNQATRRARMKIVFGSDHADLALEASQKAKRRLFVLSHRIGVAGKPNVILPALSAARSNNVSAQLFFGRSTATFKGTEAGQMTLEYSSAGLKIVPVYTPRMHAKVLAWDDDAVVITSQNWLSADPSDNNRLREIGVYIESKNVADRLIQIFQMRVAASM